MQTEGNNNRKMERLNSFFKKMIIRICPHSWIFESVGYEKRRKTSTWKCSICKTTIKVEGWDGPTTSDILKNNKKETK